MEQALESRPTYQGSSVRLGVMPHLTWGLGPVSCGKGHGDGDSCSGSEVGHLHLLE